MSGWQTSVLGQLPTTKKIFESSHSPDDIWAGPSRPTTASIVQDLTGQIILEDEFAAAHGGFADVYRGVWYRANDLSPLKVAVKVLRPQSEEEKDGKKRNKRLRRELKVWQRLDHDNIVRLCGIITSLGPYNSMVCPWIENGTLTRYLERQGVSIDLSGRLRMLCEVASGLSYLHSCEIIHGDLSGTNVLVDGEGRALVSDFGMSKIIAEFQGTSYFTSSIGGAVRWSAPELYRVYEDHIFPVVTVECDIYSFGSVTLQTITGQVPYYYIKSDLQVVFELHKGLHPRRPIDEWMSDSLWEFVQHCWSDAIMRPTISDVLRFMQSQQHETLLFDKVKMPSVDINPSLISTPETDSESPSPTKLVPFFFEPPSNTPERPFSGNRATTAPSIYCPTRSTNYIGPVLAPRIPEPKIEFESPFAYNPPWGENVDISESGTGDRFPSASVRDISCSWP